MSSVLFEHADILLRGAAGWSTLKDAFLGVRGDRIDYIGADAPAGDYERRKDLRGKLLMPGLINCHCHSPMVLLRGIGAGLPLQEWLFHAVFPIEAKLTADEIGAASRYAALELIAGGTTSFSDMYFFPEETAAAVEEAGLRANLNRLVQSFDDHERPEDNTMIKESLALHDRYDGAAQGRIKVDFCIHAEYTCKPQIVRAYSELCRARGGRMHLHLSETEREVSDCVERYGKTPVEWFAELGTFDSPTLAAHCVWVNESDRAILREKGVTAVHNPTSNLKLGSGFAPVRELLDAGVNVALGTDGTASNNNLNLFEEMHLAAIMHCGYHRDPTRISAGEVLDMVTVNGARAQGRDDTGELAVGKKADLIALRMDGPHLYPNFDTPALLTCSAQAADVCMTMVDGKLLYEDGAFLTLDADRIRADMRAAVKKLYG